MNSPFGIGVAYAGKPQAIHDAICVAPSAAKLRGTPWLSSLIQTTPSIRPNGAIYAPFVEPAIT